MTFGDTDIVNDLTCITVKGSYNVFNAIREGKTNRKEIAKYLAMDGGTVVYYLAMLEKYGFVDGEYKIIGREKNPPHRATIAMVYHANEKKYKSMADKIDKMIKTVESSDKPVS